MSMQLKFVVVLVAADVAVDKNPEAPDVTLLMREEGGSVSVLILTLSLKDDIVE